MLRKMWKTKGGYFLLVLTSGLYLAITLFLFHRQAVCYGGAYISDEPAYIAKIMGQLEGVNFPYPVLFWTAKLFSLLVDPRNACALALTGYNGLTFFILYYFLNRSLTEKGRWGSAYFTPVLTFLLLIVSMLYPYHTFFGYSVRYLRVFSPNPYHNATYLAARPFALITFFMASAILEDYESKDQWIRKETVAFSAMLLLATLTKPSFTLVLVSVCGWIMLWRLIASKWKGMKAFWQFGIAFIPTFLALLYQYFSMFTGGTEAGDTGITLGFLPVWKNMEAFMPLAVLCATAFPVAVLICQKGRLARNPLLKFAWQFFLMSLLMLMFLQETGYRAEHMNFAWGYMYGLFFLFIASAITLMKETKKHGQPRWQLVVQWLVFAAHAVYGADYLRVILRGDLFH